MINRNYQLGNIIYYNGKELVKIVSINLDYIEVEDATGKYEEAPYDLISGVPLTEGVLSEIGVLPSTRTEHPLHIKLTYTLSINGKMYHFFGHQFKDKGIWSFSGLTMLYLHHLQNLLAFVEPEYVLGKGYSC